MERIKIVLAEDHTLMREGTRQILERFPDFEVVGEAEDGRQALEMIGRLQPDVALLDIRLPRLNGIEVVRAMKSASRKTKALVLTAYDDDDYIVAMMDAGASGYLLKTTKATALAEAIRTVHAGEPVLQPSVAAKIARLWLHSRDAGNRETPDQPTPREMEVLELAAKGLRNKAIADSLNISVRTVEGHFNSIFVKLGVSSRTEAVLCAISRRLVSTQDGEH